MSAAATDYYWKNGVEPILDYLGDYVGTTVVDCVIDSYEVGAGNWTEAFDSEFENRRGYSMRPFLPTYAGYYIDSPEQTERFLWDYRRTVGDLMAENYYGRFRTLCNGRGLKLYVEPYWGPYDSMQVGDRADMVMCEFWSGLLGAFDSAKFVSSIAHVNGDPLVGAEAFTSYGAWLDYPASIKTVGDKAWAEGVNRFIFHSYTHQPWNIGPGLTFGHYGMDFNRLTTWWKPGRAYLDYVARSQFLLQQGRNVADVLVFAGESAPNDAYYMPEIKRRGYDYDLIGTYNLMKLSCDKGIIRTGAGGEYRLLYMPESRWMTPQVLAKIGDLAENGAVIVGPRPLGSPGLSDYPHCDAETRRLADRLWSAGKVSDMSLTEALTSRLSGPDFLIEGSGSPDITFIPLGILWKAPYTILLTDCLKEGDNEIEVKITNLWPNRLIGDDFLPEDYEMDGMRIRRWPEWLVSDAQRKSGRSTFTTWKRWDKTAELLPSGLCGPVCIRSYAKVRLE